MAHIIITGATGTAGSAILAECLSSPAIAKVSILSRRPVKLAEGNPKSNVIIQSDYATYPSSVLDQLRGASGVIWAQGKSQVGMTEKDYSQLTHDWPIAAAKAFADLPTDQQKMKFVYISGEGADPEEKVSTMFGRIKGRTEKDLLATAAATPSLAVYNLRPGAIDPMGQKTTPDRGFSFLRDVPIVLLGPILKIAYPSMHTPANKLAEVAIKLATGDGAPVAGGKGVEADGWTLRNTAIRRLAGL